MSQLDLLWDERTGEVEVPGHRAPRQARKASSLAKMLRDLDGPQGEAAKAWRPVAGPVAPPAGTPVALLLTTLNVAGRRAGRAGVTHGAGVGDCPVWCEHGATVEAAWASDRLLRWEGKYSRSGHLVRASDLLEPLEVLSAAGGAGSPAHRQLIRLGCLLLRCLLYADATWLALLGEVEAWTLRADTDAAELRRRAFEAELSNERRFSTWCDENQAEVHHWFSDLDSRDAFQRKARVSLGTSRAPWELLSSLTTGAEGRYLWSLGSLVSDMLVLAPDTERTTETLRALIRAAVPPSLWLADVLALAAEVTP